MTKEEFLKELNDYDRVNYMCGNENDGMFLAEIFYGDKKQFCASFNDRIIIETATEDGIMDSSGGRLLAYIYGIIDTYDTISFEQ